MDGGGGHISNHASVLTHDRVHDGRILQKAPRIPSKLVLLLSQVRVAETQVGALAETFSLVLVSESSEVRKVW